MFSGAGAGSCTLALHLLGPKEQGFRCIALPTFSRALLSACGLLPIHTSPHLFYKECECLAEVLDSTVKTSHLSLIAVGRLLMTCLRAHSLIMTPFVLLRIANFSLLFSPPYLFGVWLGFFCLFVCFLLSRKEISNWFMSLQMKKRNCPMGWLRYP